MVIHPETINYIEDLTISALASEDLSPTVRKDKNKPVELYQTEKTSLLQWGTKTERSLENGRFLKAYAT